MTSVVKLAKEYIPALGSPEQWSRCLAEQRAGERLVLLALDDGKMAGHASLLWNSCYPRFLRQQIPEIQEVLVAEAARGKRIGTTLIGSLEAVARARGCQKIGVGICLDRRYGAAQKLYVRLGYAPDGHGVTHRTQPIESGTQVSVDDDLRLWLTKSLTASYLKSRP